MPTIPNMTRKSPTNRAVIAARAEYAAGLNRRRNASRRLPGCDTWTSTPPGTQGLVDACAHLLGSGATPMVSLDDLRAAYPDAGRAGQRVLCEVAGRLRR